MQHILLRNAFNYKQRLQIKPPTNFYYDKAIGAWLSFGDKSLLVKHAQFPAVGSKKFDVETGEDHKGQ